MKTLFLRLLALALIAGGIVGLGKWRFERRYYQSASFTFSSATPQQIDDVFNEALKNPNVRNITRGGSALDRLDFHAEGTSWNDAEQSRSKMANAVQKVVRSKKLTTTSTNYGGGNLREPRYLYGARIRFIASAAVIVFGLAMMILSLKAFGGGSQDVQSPG
jgi:hypothetical protein